MDPHAPPIRKHSKNNKALDSKTAPVGFFSALASVLRPGLADGARGFQRESKSQRSSGVGRSRRQTGIQTHFSDVESQDRLGTAASVSRLGKSELGKYAYEDRMPSSLKKLLRTPEENSNHDIILAIEKLLLQCPSTRYAYLCSHSVQHIAKKRGEGSFCGYRNIQMLISHLMRSESPSSQHFPNGVSTILELQDLIEAAWDEGFNPHGRLETGGISGTRKFIGTPEAHALFSSLSIKCSAKAFRDTGAYRAHDELLQSVLHYFENGSQQAVSGRKVQRTGLPPIYFQHQGHSMTIIGIECREDELGLLVFDPGKRDPTLVKQLVQSSPKRLATTSSRLLRSYRCSRRYLRKYNEFELLL